ncbi:MAG: M3 family oligoendopeptidase [Ruminococcaceae bacterium]|nr:M3 family oligoendopeptidase [Oscillospiraceae bacterium]
MKFSEMPYKRPNVEEIKKYMIKATEDLKNAVCFEKAEEVFLNLQKDTKHIQTLATLVSVRHSINTNDKFYEEENNFWDTVSPELEEYSQNFILAMLSSKFRPDFTKKYGKLYFDNAEMAIKTFSPEIIPELQAENELVTEYGKLIASAKIEFRGNTYTLSQLAPFKTSSDDEERLEAWKADGKWFHEHQKELDEIYDKLVKLRDTMGRKMGYDGYTELGYNRMSRNCYSKHDVEKFREAVIKYLVPVADKIKRQQAERLGKAYPMNFADSALEFRSGNPRPCGSPDEIVNNAGIFYDELSPETSEFFRTMREMELMDLLSTEGKESGGYCTSIYDYEVPFIFANFNGTQHDVEVVTHEAGHAFAFWLNRNRVPMEYSWPSLEACEVHSMSMEFFAEPWSERFFGKDSKKFLYSHLSSSITFIPYGTMVDHFQHVVYEKPDMTPRERHNVWRELLGVYMPWLKTDGEIPFYSDGEAWQRQSHIYNSPFYYIDYCLAQTVALQFWALIQKDIKTAWTHYMDYTSQGGTATFTELLKKAGLDTPFDEACLKNVCADADKWLDEFDMSDIK